jgi:DNA repair exonuclease SbcCD ATPase subunit
MSNKLSHFKTPVYYPTQDKPVLPPLALDGPGREETLMKQQQSQSHFVQPPALYRGEIDGSHHVPPPPQIQQPDFSSMAWMVEISRLQAAEASLGQKVNGLSHQLGDALQEKVKLSQEQILLETQKNGLKEKLADLQGVCQTLEKNNSRLQLDNKALQNDLRSKATEYQHQVDLLNERINNLRLERDSWRRDNSTLAQSHKREIDRLEETIKTKERRYELLQAAEQTHKLEIRSLYDEQNRLKNANSTLNDQQFRSQTEISRLQAQADRQTSKIEHLTETQTKANRDIERLNEELKKSQEEGTDYRHDAEKLRAYIATGESQRGPIRDENYYVQSFGELKAEIENWIARNAKNNAARELSDQHEGYLLQSLADLGEHGERAAQYLSANNRMQKWYGAPRWRIPMVRHIVATFLFAYAFQPFIVGLPEESAKILGWIDRDIASQGKPWGLNTR